MKSITKNNKLIQITKIYPFKFNRNGSLIVFEGFFEFLSILECLVPLLLRPVRDEVGNKDSSNINKQTLNI